MVVKSRLCLESTGERGKKGVSKGNEGFQRCGFALTNQKRVQALISTRTKGRGKDEKEVAGKALSSNLDHQLRKHPVKKDMAMPSNRTLGLPNIGLTILQLQLLGGHARELTRHGWHLSL